MGQFFVEFFEGEAFCLAVLVEEVMGVEEVELFAIEDGEEGPFVVLGVYFFAAKVVFDPGHDLLLQVFPVASGEEEFVGEGGSFFLDDLFTDAVDFFVGLQGICLMKGAVQKGDDSLILGHAFSMRLGFCS